MTLIKIFFDIKTMSNDIFDNNFSKLKAFNSNLAIALNAFSLKTEYEIFIDEGKETRFWTSSLSGGGPEAPVFFYNEGSEVGGGGDFLYYGCTANPVRCVKDDVRKVEKTVKRIEGSIDSMTGKIHSAQ